MGRYAAHRVDDLPASIAARVHRAIAVAYDEPAEFTKQERLEAEALLAQPLGSRQASLELAPLPDLKSKGAR